MNAKKKKPEVDFDKETYIAALTPQLAAFRMRVGVSQEELANYIGVSRQTYSAIERGVHKMTWNTFLSLVFFYDYHPETHDALREISAFPQALFMDMPDQETRDFIMQTLFGERTKEMLAHLDLKAMHALRTVLLLEYARCTSLDGETVIKSFGGVPLGKPDAAQISARRALKNMETRKPDHE